MSIGCCETPTVTFSRNDDMLVVGDHVQTNNALCPTGVIINRGDLLKLNASTNSYSLATLPGDFDAIAIHSLTVVQTTAHAAAGYEIAGYTQGEFDIAMCSLSGVKLTLAQYAPARGRGAQLNIELRKVVV
jgi:hypothetical protein